MKRILFVSLLFIAPSLTSTAWADTDNSVILMIENEAGVVTTVPSLTQKECDAVSGLLGERKYGQDSGFISGGTSGAVYFGSIQGFSPQPKPVTSKLTTVKCVRSTSQLK